MDDIWPTDGIIRYLREDLERSIENDVGIALEGYTQAWLQRNVSAGFFGIPRLIFPVIDSLGSFYAGTTSNTPKNAIAFIREYFGRVNPKYRESADFLYSSYRHGLMHQNFPKVFSYRKSRIGWSISLGTGLDPYHLCSRPGDKGLIIGVRNFYIDLRSALDLYINDLSDPNRGPDLVNKWVAAWKDMNEPIGYSGYLRNHKYLHKSGFDFLRH